MGQFFPSFFHILLRNTYAYPCLRHELLLLLVPDRPDVGVAVPVQDGEGDEDHVGLGVGEGAHVLILLLARRVADPEDTVTIIIYLSTHIYLNILFFPSNSYSLL